VPRVAAVLSAWGMLATDLRFEVARTHIGDVNETGAGQLDGAAVLRLFAELGDEATRRLRASFDGPMRLQRSVDMRYGEQIFEINVPLDDVDWDAPDPLPQIVERFHRRHEALYTYALRGQDAVLVNARVVAVGVLPDLPQEPVLPAGPAMPAMGERRVFLGGWSSVPVYDFEALAPQQAIAGPAIVESAMTTVLLRPEDRAMVTPHGWLDIAVPLRGEAG
jgi:N-methylhydantoinase A